MSLSSRVARIETEKSREVRHFITMIFDGETQAEAFALEHPNITPTANDLLVNVRANGVKRCERDSRQGLTAAAPGRRQ